MENRVVRIPPRATALFVFAILAGSSVLFAQRKTEITSPTLLTNRELAGLTVARVGPWNITGYEFKLGYEFGPAFVKRNPNSKRRYLNYLIYEKLLALDAQSRGLDRWRDLKSQVSEIEADLATKELYKDDVLKKVHITNSELANAVGQERVNLSVQWVFLHSAHDVDDAVKRMNLGFTFDSLFAQQLGEGVHADDRTMQSTRFKLGMRNPLFAGVIDTLARGNVSLPVHGPDGWYIVHIADRWKNPIVTQTEEEKMTEDVRRALTQQKGDSLSDVYVQRIVADSHPIILREPFNAIEAYLGKIYLPREKYDDWQLRKRKGASSLSDSSNLDPIAADTLVTMNKGKFTVRDFLEWYRMRESYIKLDRSTQDSFFQSVEQIVWRMVRDRLLTQRAYAQGLQKRINVRRETEWWKEKMLYIANKNRIGDTITDSLPALQLYYNEHKRSFTDENGNVKSFDTVKEDVWKEYYNSELTKKLLHAILALKQKYPVTIEERTLQKIPVDDEDNPRTIDVYTVQKGGIYPHTAFPSIDYDWQSWE
jgi:hypothetical protein